MVRLRQLGAAVALYGSLGMGRDDKQGRAEAMLKNWQFFGAPHAVYFSMDKYLNIMGVVDVGILFGMSFGYPDADINKARTDRVDLDAAVNFVA